MELYFGIILQLFSFNYMFVLSVVDYTRKCERKCCKSNLTDNKNHAVKRFR